MSFVDSGSEWGHGVAPVFGRQQLHEEHKEITGRKAYPGYEGIYLCVGCMVCNVMITSSESTFREGLG